MHITAALSIPVHFIAKGFRRLVATSGSVTRYKLPETTFGKRRPQFEVFRAPLADFKQSYYRGRPVTNPSVKSYESFLAEPQCFHIRKKTFLGLRFRRFKSAVGSNDSKNVKLLSFKQLGPFDDARTHWVTKPTNVSGAKKKPAAKAALLARAKIPLKPPLRPIKSLPFSDPPVFLRMLDEALDRLMKYSVMDLDKHLQKQSSELAMAKNYCLGQYKHRISKEFESFLYRKDIRPTVGVQCAAYIAAQKKVQKELLACPGDLANFATFMSQFDLQVWETHFMFSRYTGMHSLYMSPTVLRPPFARDGRLNPEG